MGRLTPGGLINVGDLTENRLTPEGLVSVTGSAAPAVPTLSLPTSDTITSSTANINVTTDTGNGTLWFIVTTTNSQPNATQIKAGQDGSGTSTNVDDSGSQAVSATGVQTVAASGLTASTTYYYFFYQENTVPTGSNITTSATFDTIAAAVKISVTVEQWLDGTAYASQTAIEYATWADSALGSLGAPDLQGNTETTDGTGLLEITVTGTYALSDVVLVAISKGTLYGLGATTVVSA